MKTRCPQCRAPLKYQLKPGQTQVQCAACKHHFNPAPLKMGRKPNAARLQKQRPAPPREKDFSLFYILLALAFGAATGILLFGPDVGLSVAWKAGIIAGLWIAFFVVAWFCEMYACVQVIRSHLAQLNQKMDLYLSDTARRDPPSS